jgi:hypothetical protein
MSSAAIELYHEAELWVFVVQVPSAVASPAPRLTSGTGQAVAEFHVAQISPFQYGVNAIADIDQGAA